MATGTTTKIANGQNDPGTEPQLSRPARIRRWLGENLWLVIGGLVVLMMAPSAARDAETPEMRENRAKIEGMTQTERDLLLSNFDSWRKLSPNDRRSLREMHDVVAKDEELSRTLTEYHTWLAGVSSSSYEVRDRILNETDPEKRLRIIEGHLDRKRKEPGPKQPGDQAPYKPDGGNPDPFFTGLQRGPSLFGRDFENVIDVVAEWADVPQPDGNRTPVVVLKFHLNVLEQAGTKLRDIRSGNGPVRVPDKVVAKILEAISNEERRDEIAIVVGDNPAALLMLLLRSIRSEDIRRIAMNNGPMLEEFFETLPPQQRLVLNRLPEKEHTMRVTWMWVEKNIPGAMDSMKRFMRFNREPGQGRFQPGNRRPGQQNPRPFFPNNNRRQSDTSSED
jgi:hypothetical protein